MVYSLDAGSGWDPGCDPEDVADMANCALGQPNTWTGGGRDEDLDALVGVAGIGAYARTLPWIFDGCAWSHAHNLDLEEDPCRIFTSVPGWLQTPRRRSCQHI